MNPARNLAKLTISPEMGGIIEVMFNPNSYSISKSVTWNAAGGKDGKSETNRQVNAPPLSLAAEAAASLAWNSFLMSLTSRAGTYERRQIRSRS
jgi:hypothetical protein